MLLDHSDHMIDTVELFSLGLSEKSDFQNSSHLIPNLNDVSSNCYGSRDLWSDSDK